MRILMVGDIVGGPGRAAFREGVRDLRDRGGVDVVVVNAENAAGGKGLTSALAQEIFDAGADVITLGDHSWDQKELVKSIDLEHRILRPANFAPGCPGRGDVTIEIAGRRVMVISLVGRVFMPPQDCPFRTVDDILTKHRGPTRLVLVDLHAEATSEKIAMGRYLDGRVTAVVGTHTHVQTSDERILPGGTACLTDLGMTGPTDSVIGRETKGVLHMFTTGMPTKFEVGGGPAVFEGALIDADDTTGRATRIERVRRIQGGR